MENQVTYFLSLQRMPGDTKFIDVSKLNISNGYNPHTLEAIDLFTTHFSTEEIMQSIKDANIVEDSYQNGTLIVQDNQKHKPLKVIDKTFMGEFNLYSFFKDNIFNRSLMNNIAYKLGTILDNEYLVSAFKESVKCNNLEMMLNILFQTPYPIQRKFMIYLIELYHKELAKKSNQAQELIRDKAA